MVDVMSAVNTVLSRKYEAVEPSTGRDLRPYTPLLLVIALFLLVALFVRPFGNYPIDDGAGYGLTIFRLVREGSLQFPSWAAMTMVTQLAYGTVACLLMGTSFTALQLSTLVVSIVGIGFVYLLALELGANKNVASLITASIALNPIYFALSFRFISDTPHFVFLVIGSWLFVRAGRKADWYSTPGITVMSILAVMSRQCGICMPLATLASNLLRQRITVRSVAVSVLPFVLSLVGLLVFDYWKSHSGQHSLNYRSLLEIAGHSPSPSLGQIVSRLVRIPLYCGFFVAPISLAVFCGYWKNRRSAFVIIALAAVAYAAGVCAFIRPMPACSAIFEANGLGPKSFPIELPEIAVWIRWILTWVCSVSLLSMLYESFAHVALRKLEEVRTKPIFTYAIVFGVIYLASILRLQAFYDKYTLPLALPGLLLLLINRPFERMRVSAGWIAAVSIAAVTCFSAFNYYSYNSACWDLIRLAVRNGVQPEHFNGGFECNLLFSHEPHSAAVNDWYTWCPQTDATLSVGADGNSKYARLRGIESPCLFGKPIRVWLCGRWPANAQVVRSAETGDARLKQYGIYSSRELSPGSKWLMDADAPQVLTR